MQDMALMVHSVTPSSDSCLALNAANENSRAIVVKIYKIAPKCSNFTVAALEGVIALCWRT